MAQKKERERERERVHWGVDAMPNKGKCECGAAFRARCKCAEGTPGSFRAKPKNEKQVTKTRGNLDEDSTLQSLKDKPKCEKHVTKRVASEEKEAPEKAQSSKK